MSVILWQTFLGCHCIRVEVMKLLQRFRLARALRRLSAGFEMYARLPGSTEREWGTLDGLPPYGPLEVRNWKNELAGYDRHHVTNGLLRQIKHAQQRGDLQSHRARVAMWHALASEGLATSAADWMCEEFGLEPVQKPGWFEVRYPY